MYSSNIFGKSKIYGQMIIVSYAKRNLSAYNDWCPISVRLAI
jgi:hypothetical protein